VTAGSPAVRDAAGKAVEQALRAHWGRLLALLTGQFGSLDGAEDAVADAFELAIVSWPRDGVPARPEAWLLTAARRRALDRLRRDATLARKLPLLAEPEPVAGPADAAVEVEMSTIPDDRLRLLFTCCHPALALEARVALTLRCLGGLTTAEVARAFLVPEATMAARITRAKKKIAAAGIPYRVPTDAELPARLAGLLAVLYLVFNEGYAATSGDEAIRRDLCDEAIRLARVVVALMPDEPEAVALLALLLLQNARRDARLDPAGRLVLLPDQDRSRWHAGQLAEGLALLTRAGRASPAGRAGPYLLQAAIAAEHGRARRAADTDWAAIAALYRALDELTGSPVVRLNRAVAEAEAAGPAAGLALLAGLDERLPGFHLLPATRADLLRRLGAAEPARREYARALELAGNAADRELLRRRLAQLGSPGGGAADPPAGAAGAEPGT
jgi:RNA polymerase sigma-70 factor (ECF subfamily)